MIKSIFSNSFGILFSRIFGFIRDLLTANILGANIYSDIFFVAFKFPNLFRRIFAEGAFSQSFLPTFIQSKYKSVFSVKIFLIFLGLITFLTLLVQVFTQEATQILAIGFSDALIDQASVFVAINFYYLIFIFIVTFLSALLQYKDHFATSAFSTALLNISLIVALILSKDLSQKTIVYYLSYGVLIGGLLQVLAHIIAIYYMRLMPMLYGGFKYLRKKSYLVKKESTQFKNNFFPAVWGSSTAQISAFIDTWLASFLMTGSISYLYYANRIFQLPLALFAIAVSIAIFPKISRLLHKNKNDIALEKMSFAFWFLLSILSVSSIVGMLLNQEITQLLFQRGSFTQQNSIDTAMVLNMYLIGLLPFGLSRLFSLWLYATHQLKLSAKIATYSLLFNIILSLLFIETLGAKGLALASSLSGFLQLILTIKAFGLKSFVLMFNIKYSVYFMILLSLTILLVMLFKTFVLA